MITLGTQFRGFDARSWHRLVTLLAPGLASRAPHEFAQRAAEDGGTLLVLYQGPRVLRALHTHRGVVLVDAWPGPEGLAELAQAHGARFAAAAEAGALEELNERVGARLRIDDDAPTTLLVLLGAARELYDEGAVHLWPDLVPSHVPLPTPAVLRRVFDFLLPEGRAALVALFDQDQIDTAVVLHRRGGALEQVLGPEALRELAGPLGGDFRRDHRVLRQAVEREIAPLAVGLFSETATVHTLLRATKPGAWTSALATREVVLDPMPGWLAVAAGAGAVRAAAARSRGLLAGLGLLGTLNPAMKKIREAVDAVGAFDPTQVLGFDPLRVLAEVLGRSSASGSTPRDSRED
jgi:hypothetical protein